MNVDEQIRISDTLICKNIDTINEENIWLASQNILNWLRTFVEAIAVKITGQGEYKHEIYKEYWIPLISTKSKYKFLYTFHQNLQISESHYDQDEANSQRLILKYYEYLIKIKNFLKKNYNIDVLHNVNKLDSLFDKSLSEYYIRISEKIKNWAWIPDNTFKDSYYIWKKKPIIIGNEILYEITFSTATDYVSKFDKLIAFTKKDILSNYAVKLEVKTCEINFLWWKIPILLISNYEVSIRPCEFSNYAKILWYDITISRNYEYNKLMEFLTKYWFNLLEIVNFPNEKYMLFKSIITNKASTQNILMLLDKSREIILGEKNGCNILRYLLYTMNNKTIKKQYQITKNPKLSNLNLQYWCIPFDTMPYSTSLIDHNPIFWDLINCISPIGKEHELLSKYLANRADDEWQLYTKLDELPSFKNIEELIDSFNIKLFTSEAQRTRKLCLYKNFIYRESNEIDLLKIIEKTHELCEGWIDWYTKVVEDRLNKNPWEVDDEVKKEILKKMFCDSKISLIYWSAWTWKTMLIKHLSELFRSYKKIFLANTNPAVNNLKSRVNQDNSEFYTISKWLLNKSINKCDILIIDECSTISNSDIAKILQKIKFDLLIFVWDTYQIESISFWNWFSIIRNFVPSNSVYELSIPYRTKNRWLIKLWDIIRNINSNRRGENNALEIITNYSKALNEFTPKKFNEDEIILCLNYDGLYWINNINKFLQWNNPQIPIQWWTHVYKIDDPILFNENQRFNRLLYNNLKWKIVDIMKSDKKIYFTVEIDKIIEANDVLLSSNLELLWVNEENGTSIIKFSVSKLENTDTEESNSEDTIVPFQVAYAVSIHKAQWLEYDSVKIIISDEIWEKITHNIFYTAITRARENLTIYRSPQTSKKILDSLVVGDCNRDANILKEKL